MAVCVRCNRKMTGSKSCIKDVITHKGKQYAPIRYGDEKDLMWNAKKQDCPDCGVKVGGIHHFGCDVEECTLCGGQFISCYCREEEECT